MPRLLTRSLQVVIDLLVLSAVFWLASLARFEFAIPPTWVGSLLRSWPYVVGVQYAALAVFGIPRFSWRYFSMREAVQVALAMAVASAAMIALRLGLPSIDLFGLPLGVLCANFFVGIASLVGARAARRIYCEAKERKLREAGRKRTRVLLIGAGQAGMLVSREIASRPDLGLQAVGFLDDDRRKLGSQIGGLSVLGTVADLAEVAERKHIERVLITIANASGADIRRITLHCRDAGLETKIIPGIYEIVGDRVNLSRIREVAIEDLLGREPVELDEADLSRSIRDRVVLVTGAGGSIGSELCRQLCGFSPARLVLVERFENALFAIHRELAAAHPHLTIDAKVGDVTDAIRVERIFAESRPSLVLHAAAHKHVPMMEHNPGEAIKNNVVGTRTVADIADKFGVERFVLVSTDKAVNPTSVMGASKRVAEIYTQALGQRSKTKFVTVRFGNVLGSNGSVVPIFKQQIERGGPVTVTHPEMQRYFMTIPEASQLVLQAGSMGQGSEIFILDMGKPVKIVDLARDLITLSGFRPDDDIAIEFTGVRPGEKLFEQLLTNNENADKTKHPKIFIGRIRSVAWDEAVKALLDLSALVDAVDASVIRLALRAVVPEYSGAQADADADEESEGPSEVPSPKPRRANTSGASDVAVT